MNACECCRRHSDDANTDAWERGTKNEDKFSLMTSDEIMDGIKPVSKVDIAKSTEINFWRPSPERTSEECIH